MKRIMTNHNSIYFLFAILLILATMLACNTGEEVELKAIELEEIIDSVDRLKPDENVSTIEDNSRIDTLEIVVVPCANGYEYGMHNYDFNPIIEHELDEFENIVVKPFPLSAMKNVAYQGVFDRKYCLPMLEVVHVDYLVLTRFDKNYDALNRTKMKWGYELRVVNAITLEQINTISASNLEDYSEIEKHIKDNIELLKADLEKLR